MTQLDFGKWAKNRAASLVVWIGTTTKLVANNVQDALVELANRTFSTYFDFHWFASEGTASTNSELWEIKLSETTPVLDGGSYLIFWTAEVGQTKKSSSAGFRVLVDNVVLTDTRDGVTATNQYMTRSGFAVRTLTNGTQPLSIEYGQASGGGDVLIRRVRILLFRIA